MNKKFLFVGMAAILGASLVFFACDSSTEGSAGAAGAPGPMPPATLPPGATPALLQAYYDSGVSKVFMVDTPATTGTFTVPAGKTLELVGTVNMTSVTAGIIDAYYGTLDVSRGSFTGASNIVFIVPEAKQPEVKAAAPGSTVPAVVTDVGTSATGDVILETLSIGGTSQPTAADFLAFAGANTIYVPGTVTVTGTFDTSTAKLVVLDEMRAGAVSGAAATLTLGANTKVNKLTATSNIGLVGITVDAATKPKVNSLNTGSYTVTSTDTIVALDSLDSSGTGKLVLAGAVTVANIGGGNGNIEFTNSTTPTGFTTRASLITAGKITFTNGFTNVALSLVTLGGRVVLPDTKYISLGAAAGTLTLLSGTEIAVTASDGSNEAVVLKADSNTVLTPTDGAKLTAAAATTGGTPAKLTLDTANLTVTRGTLDMTGDLVVTGQTLTLMGGAKLTGTGKVVAQHTEIVGGTGGWTAVGTSIAINAATSNKTTITASSAVLTAGEGATITQLAVAGNELNIATGTTIALGNNGGAALGSIVLMKHDTQPGKLAFGGAAAQITTGVDTTGATALTASGGGAFVGTATLSKMGVSAFATASTTNFVTITGGANKLVSIVYGDGSGTTDPFITGPTAGDNSGTNGVISAATNCANQ